MTYTANTTATVAVAKMTTPHPSLAVTFMVFTPATNFYHLLTEAQECEQLANGFAQQCLSGNRTRDLSIASPTLYP